MLENVSDGLVGLFMFLSNWFSPGTDAGEIKIAAAQQFAQQYVIECVIKIPWNEQMSDVIDAGIPLRFKIQSNSDLGDSLSLIRTMQCDISTYTYMYIDTIQTPAIDSVYVSTKYTKIFKALRETSKWSSSFSKKGKQFHMEALLLPSTVSQLNRTIDLSEICNCRKFSRDLLFNPKPDKKADKKSKKRKNKK
jgi:hypothetical protein